MNIITDASFRAPFIHVIKRWGQILDEIIPKTVSVSASTSKDASGRWYIELEFRDTIVPSARNEKSFAPNDSDHQVMQLANEAIGELFQLGTKEIQLENSVEADSLSVEAFNLKDHEFEPIKHIRGFHRVMGRTHHHCIQADGRSAYKVNHFDGSDERWFMLVDGDWKQVTRDEALQRLEFLNS